MSKDQGEVQEDRASAALMPGDAMTLAVAWLQIPALNATWHEVDSESTLTVLSLLAADPNLIAVVPSWIATYASDGRLLQFAH